MTRSTRRRARLLAAAFGAGCIAPAIGPAPARAADTGTIKIGIIAEMAAIGGAAIPNGAQMAADEINAKGGIGGRKIELVVYDDHSQSSDAVRAFQRAVNEDHVNAVVASYVSEVALALMPWAARLHTLFLTPGAASDEISKRVHDNYDTNKYTFHAYMASTFLADSTCDGAKDLLVDGLHMKSAVIMSEDAAWTTPLDAEFQQCLPKVGLKVLDHIRFSPDTTDFTPIFNGIEGKKPDVIVTGISHVGVQPTVQWHDQQVPIPMFGISSQATSTTFWKDTNGATEGVVFQTVSAPDAAITPKTQPFVQAYIKKYGVTPAYTGYTAYDDVYMIANAVEKAGGLDEAKMVTAMEATDYVGTIGTIKFYPKDNIHAHAIEYGPGLVTGQMVDWLGGKQVTVWPADLAKAKMTFPSFIKINAASK